MMMKKIANKVALQTIGYSIPGNQKVKIVAYSNHDCCWRKAFPQVLFNDVWSNFHTLDSNKLFVASRTDVARTEVEIDPYGVPVLVLNVVCD